MIQSVLLHPKPHAQGQKFGPGLHDQVPAQAGGQEGRLPSRWSRREAERRTDVPRSSQVGRGQSPGLFDTGTLDGIDGSLTMGLAQWVHGAPFARVALFSGGSDSASVTCRAMDEYGFDMVAHVATGTGIPSTEQHVIDFCQQRGYRLGIYRPPLDTITGIRGLEYQAMVAGLLEEEVTLILFGFMMKHNRAMEHWEMRRYNVYPQKGKGFPGPGAHDQAYNRLKERAFRELRRDLQEKNGQRVWFASGVRSQESKRRTAHVEPVQKDGAIVWVAPIWHWSKGDCHAYMDEKRVFPSPASQCIGMSGECLCLAYAKEGEVDRLASFAPEAVEPILALEDLARSRGVKCSTWGNKPHNARKKVNIMCVGCATDPKVPEVSSNLEEA